jgi:hypothetical protein
VTYSGSGVAAAARSPETEFVVTLERDVADAVIRLRTERGSLRVYRLTLRCLYEGAWQTVRVYDNVHGVHDMHRHTLERGKLPAKTFHFGTPREAYGEARRAVEHGYREMIAGWLK